MIIITIRMEAEKKTDPRFDSFSSAVKPDSGALGVNVELDNTQIGHKCMAALRCGESVEHRLRLDASGRIDLRLFGWTANT